MKDKYLKIIGFTLIGIGISFFYFFFDIMIGFLFYTEITLESFLPTIGYVLWDIWPFHIPGFVLIGVGIYYLKKSRKMSSKGNIT